MARTQQRRIEASIFKFKPFSKKQLQVLTWWTETSPVKSYDGIIADGAIRSGKTISMSLSFVLWAMTSFDNQNFAMCGKTILSFRRNVIFWLKLMLRSRGYEFSENRSDNLLTVWRGNTVNYFYLFGGKDERSQDLIQGVTLAGVFFDEVALMPESFVNQATGRCSVEGSKFWFNCNPEGSSHWFLLNWIKQNKQKRLLYLHFTMEDNLSLSENIKERYRSMYSGIFYKRYVLGEWAAAEGAIYMMLSNNPEDYIIDDLPDDLAFLTIGIDFGGNKSGHSFTCTGFNRKITEITTVKDYYKQGIITPDQLQADFIQFIEEVEKLKIPIVEIRADSAEQVLIAGLQDALLREGKPYVVSNAKKGAIIDRIRLYTTLLARKRWKIMRECKSTIEAFQTAVFDPKSLEDKRLDDGSTIIDPIDSQEYSTEAYTEALLYGGWDNE
ncbi:MAG: PBSX family phage terminase large subunit [Saccharofermentanales bacterium]|jgi:PBSX family phage terminase large subunit